MITLNVESKIHAHAIAASDTGTAQGSRRTNRAARLPGKLARNTWAAAVARTMTSAWEPTVTTIVFHSARRKTGSERIAA